MNIFSRSFSNTHPTHTTHIHTNILTKTYTVVTSINSICSSFRSAVIRRGDPWTSTITKTVAPLACLHSCLWRCLWAPAGDGTTRSTRRHQ